MKDAFHSVKHIGPTYKTSACVIKDIKYLDNNKIGDKGCLHLSKAHWPNLETIDLVK